MDQDIEEIEEVENGEYLQEFVQELPEPLWLKYRSCLGCLIICIVITLFAFVFRSLTKIVLLVYSKNYL